MCHHEQDARRNMYVTSNLVEVSDGNEQEAIWNWRKGCSCNRVAKNLAELCPTVLWKAVPASNEIGYLTEITKC